MLPPTPSGPKTTKNHAGIGPAAAFLDARDRPDFSTKPLREGAAIPARRSPPVASPSPALPGTRPCSSPCTAPFAC